MRLPKWRVVPLLAVVLSCLRSALAITSTEELTEENWESATRGKWVFIMFHSKCAQCKVDRPHFKRLARELEDNREVLVGDVDCSDEDGQAVCEHFGVVSVPTYLFGDPNVPDTYGGQVDVPTFSAFVEQYAGPICGPLTTKTSCKRKEVALIDKFMGTPMDTLESEIVSGDKKLRDLRLGVTQAYKEFQEELDIKADTRAPRSEFSKEYSKKEGKAAKEKQEIENGGHSLKKQVYALRLRTMRNKDKREL